MNFDLKKRNYKDACPLETINKIRTILADIDCFTYETVWANLFEDMYSVRIETLSSFGTNGKGRSRDYALASAYGEFMERIQNNLHTGTFALTRILYENIKKECGFYVYPDEKILSKKDFLNLPKMFLENLEMETNCDIKDYADIYYTRIIENGFDGVLSIPFYDIKNDNKVYIPFNLLHSMTGSNGMCAGNTESEALFQGICELIERYSAYTIYYKRITPPTISKEYLSKHCKTEFEIITKIEESGKYEVIIKDFSAGKKLPCLASLVINKESQKYRLNVGCDTNFNIALSRTLTELFQGVFDEDYLEEMSLPIPQVEHDYFLKTDSNSVEKKNSQFLEFTKNGKGVFPKSLFENDFSYQFEPVSFDGDKPYDLQVSNLIHFLTGFGFEIYIRNVSFLGFPAYHIYSPFLSTYGKKHDFESSKQNTFLINRTVTVDKIENLFFPIKTIDNQRIKELILILEKSPSSLMKNALKLSVKKNNLWDSITVDYFLVIFNYITEDYEKSLESLDVLIKDFNLTNIPYYIVLKELIQNKITGMADFQIKKNLEIKYDNIVVDEVLNDFKNRDSILSGIQMPNCPDCKNCSIYNDCNTKELVNLSISIINKGKKININQEDLKKFQPNFSSIN